MSQPQMYSMFSILAPTDAQTGIVAALPLVSFVSWPVIGLCYKTELNSTVELSIKSYFYSTLPIHSISHSSSDTA